MGEAKGPLIPAAPTTQIGQVSTRFPPLSDVSVRCARARACACAGSFVFRGSPPRLRRGADTLAASPPHHSRSSTTMVFLLFFWFCEQPKPHWASEVNHGHIAYSFCERDRLLVVVVGVGRGPRGVLKTSGCCAGPRTGRATYERSSACVTEQAWLCSPRLTSHAWSIDSPILPAPTNLVRPTRTCGEAAEVWMHCFLLFFFMGKIAQMATSWMACSNMPHSLLPLLKCSIKFRCTLVYLPRFTISTHPMHNLLLLLLLFFLWCTVFFSVLHTWSWLLRMGCTEAVGQGQGHQGPLVCVGDSQRPRLS